MRVLVVANPDKHEALRLAGGAESLIRAEGLDVRVSTNFDERFDDWLPDLAVVFGGDGTVLGTVARFTFEPPPILAFNMGRLGYLADNPPSRMPEILRLALTGRLQASCRMMIEARMQVEGHMWRHAALNEFVLFSRHTGRLLMVSVWVDGEELMDIRGDGMIVATATGSTAYAMSVGGPVASPELKGIILAPLCPHQLANRSLILHPDEVVTLRHHGEHPAELMADGRFCRVVDKGEAVEFRMSSRTVRLLSPVRGRYKVLREKLGWGWKAEWERAESGRWNGYREPPPAGKD